MKRQALVLCAVVCSLVALSVVAQPRSRGVEDPIPLKDWAVPFDQLRAKVMETEPRLIAERFLNPSTNSVPTAASQFITVAPCRVVDTRNANGLYGGPKLVGGASRSFMIPSGPCPGIPAGVAYSLNLTVTQPEADNGFLKAYPSGSAQPLIASLNFNANETRGNAAIVPADGVGSIDIFTNVNTHLIIDINGYFMAAGGVTNLTTYTYPNPAAGSYSLTIPGGVTRIVVEAWGGGGGGGYGSGPFGGQYGGMGGYARVLIPVSSNTTLTVTIGGGGAGATVANGNGTAGGNTTIVLNATTLLTAGGGSGGLGSNFGSGAGGTVSGDPSDTFFQNLTATSPGQLGFVPGAGGLGGSGAPGASGKAGLVTVTFVQ
jgi:hypothetical protein